MYDGSFGTYCLPEKSPLMLNGYTVREEAGYTAIERQNILARIMDNHILSRHEIKYYLKWFIKGQENDPRKTNAVQKWKEDLDFVVNYRLHELPLVLIGSIERKT